jgi:cell division protein FtsB
MIRLFAKKPGRRRKPKQEKSKWWSSLWKKMKGTNKRKLRSTVRKGNVRQTIDKTGWYRAFLKSKLFNVVLMIIVIYMVYLTGREALVNYYQSKQVARIESENAKIRQKNEEQKYLLEYYKTDSYAELEARKHLNMKKKDEQVVIVPVDLTDTQFGAITEETEEIKQKPNYKKWWDFVFADISQLPSEEGE